MSVLPKRRLGETPLRVSTLGFGGAPLGGFRSDVDDRESDATMNAALQRGITYFDTAPLYGYGRSEHRLGRVLRNLPRDDFVLSTKVGRYLKPLRQGEDASDLRSGGLPFRPVFDYSYDGTMRAYEQSVARLGLSRIDILLIHDVAPDTHGKDTEAQRRFEECLKGAVPALTELRKAGDIKAFGVGLNDTEWCVRFIENADVDCVMAASGYTLLDQTALDHLLPACASRNISLLIGGPYNSGILATGPVPTALYRYQQAPQEIITRTGRIQAVCSSHGVALQAAALQFALGHPSVCSVVAGASKKERVEANIAHMTREIPHRLWDDLKLEGLMDARCPTPSGAVAAAAAQPIEGHIS